MGDPDNVPVRPAGLDVCMSDTYDIEEFLAAMPQGMGALNEKLGIEIVEISPERVVATMPVEGNTQPYGLLHGGASVALAETLGSIGSALHAMPDRLSVGVDINATHHRAATGGTVTATATAIHLGRTSAAYEVVIKDEAGKRVCTSRITCALLPAERYS
jgi:1,4-dihydroxy-2-naphthoyl-CoA hydrolase